MKRYVIPILFNALILLSSFNATTSMSGGTKNLSTNPTESFSMAPQAASAAYTYPLQLNSTHQYLVDQNNQPFFWAGDAAWSLIVQLTKADADYYLENRRQRGFNTVLVELIEHYFSNNAPANIYGARPFTGKAFTTPNETYFAHADYVITSAAQKGIVVLLNPLYIGYNCQNDGWCAEIKAASTADMQAWGRYVGNRYKNFDNIVWIIGGDTDPTVHGIQDKVSAFANALRQADSRHLMTAHNAEEQMAVTPWPGAAWLSINNLYTYGLTYLQARTAYQYSPTMPFFQVEGAYENWRSPTQQTLRSQAYWPVLSGGFGFQFGNAPIWCFSAPDCLGVSGDWKAELNKQGSVSMSHAAQFFSSYAWHTLIPDWSHITLTSGYGTWGQSNYATAAMSSDLSTMIAYIPSARTVTINLSRFSSPVIGKWYDPTNGVYSSIPGSPFSNNGSVQLTTPGNNSTGDKDWVLVIQASNPILLRKTHIPTLFRD